MVRLKIALPASGRVWSSTSLVKLILGLFTGMASLVLVSRLDLGAVTAALQHAQMGYVSLAIACNTVYFGVRGLRWWLVVRTMSSGLGIWPALRSSSLGVMMSSLYPGLGEVTRLVLLRRRGISSAVATAAIVEERLIDTSALLGVLLIIAVSAPSLLPPHTLSAIPRWTTVLSASTLAGCLVAGLILIGRRDRLGRLQRGLAAIARTPLGCFVATFAQSWRVLLQSPGQAVSIMAATIIAQGLTILTGWTAFVALGLPIPPVLILLFVVVINLGLGLFPSPLGVGLYQAAGLLVLSSVAESAEAAVAAATVVQAINYGVTLSVALVASISELRPTALGVSCQTVDEPAGSPAERALVAGENTAGN